VPETFTVTTVTDVASVPPYDPRPRTWASIRSIVAIAAWTWPCVSNQRGLSGMWRRISKTASPSSAPNPNATRQPIAIGNIEGLSTTRVTPAPSATPTQ
jgi:hypothetical protein